MRRAGKRELRLDPRAAEVTSGQRHHRHRGRDRWRSSPSCAAIEGPGDVAERAVHDGGALTRRAGVHLDRVLLIIVEALVHARGDEAGETCQALGTADRLDVPVEDLIGRRLAGRLRQDFIGLEDDRVAVLHRQVRDHPGAVRAAMAGEAADQTASAEHRLVQAVDHRHHPARGPFQIGVIGIPGPVAAGLFNVAVGAVQAQGCGKHPHGAHEFLDGNAFEQLDVLEDFFGELRALGRRLRRRRHDPATRPGLAMTDGTDEQFASTLTSGSRRCRKTCCSSPVPAASSSTP